MEGINWRGRGEQQSAVMVQTEPWMGLIDVELENGDVSDILKKVPLNLMKNWIQ